ncbi:hypothetical protein D9619_010580 [Psilocybe cf. subviscida]|uniref:Uncharacterized protein n=1 Tax=Psilocybe cf. subviscida TaxID=2480587 RepID=A0A8H5AT32_9AGAR|nr:hypothetical protein D9619_010580 [Psilocybe cf. subviscida]
MPSLETLQFGFDNLRLISPPNHVEPLQLPLLQELVIDVSPASVTRPFLSNSSFRGLRNGSFECSFGEGSDLDEHSITIGVVFPLITEGNFGCLNRLVIGDSSLTLSKLSNPPEIWENQHAIAFHAIDYYRPSAIGTTRELMKVLGALPSNPTTQIVHLSVAVDLTSEQFVELFGHLPQLESICGDGISCQHIIESLKIPPQHPLDIPIPFSKVNTIRFFGQRHADECSPELLEELCHCLTERYMYGAVVSKLLLYWDLTREEVQQLQEFVADVECRKL